MNALTIDLEDWFQVYNLSKIIKYEDWDKQEKKIKENTHKILTILDKHKTHATFFVLGWIADKFPELIKEIHNCGHEIACHGYNHRPIFELTKTEFEKDLDRAIKSIKNITGVKPIGYRAPSFSVVKDTLWALDILQRKGFKYDSSMAPVKHPEYGIKGIPNQPFMIKGILEIPLTTYHGLPIGGCYFRIYPYWLTKYIIKSIIKKNDFALFYLHPWELEPKIPKCDMPLSKRFRHYTGLKNTEKKFINLLKDFRFDRIDKFLIYNKI